MRKKEERPSGMVDVSHKKATKRIARAAGQISLSSSALEVLATNSAPKGDVLATAKVAGIMAAKRTSGIIPLCHPLELNHIHMSFSVDNQKAIVNIFSEVSYQGRTGVEMEALTAVSVAALTIYDMLKGIDPRMCISGICLLEKKGGTKGTFKKM
ncbi:MAG: cyclic pyranopterin monophosphate synthase MoaC [Candidatus Omnitrophica bacterium]|nr:cyclic pyranopterin monophosphate synthase MoaC [Candidatus Omnitrophota bacterium]